jgi:hypothetical protein
LLSCSKLFEFCSGVREFVGIALISCSPFPNK